MDWPWILEKAIRSPTPDNSQPFQFRVFGSQLEVRANEFRSKHVYNYRNLSNWLSLGLAWETWAQLLGPQQRIDLLKLQEDPFLACFSLSSEPSNVQRFFPDGVLQSRRTHRGPFRKAYLSDSEKASLCADLAEVDGHLIFNGTSEFHQLSEHILSTEELFWRNPQAVADTFSWIRWTKAQLHKSQDGFSRQDLGAGRMELISLLIPWKFPSLAPWFYRALKPVILGKLRRNLLSSPGFALVNVEGEPQTRSLLELGRRGARCWYALTHLGFACQPFSVVSYLAVIEQWSQSQRSLSSPQSLTLLSSLFGKPLQLPWVFRFGVPEQDVPLSLRRKVDLELGMGKVSSID